MSTELYISTDIEADGRIPGPHSMLSFASVALDLEGHQHGTFTANLDLLEGAAPDPETAQFWAQHQAAYNATRTDTKPPQQAMTEYATWLESLPGKPVFVGYPAAWDFMFIYWYLIRFAGRSPFSHSALDIKTLAMAMLKKPYRESTKRNMPGRWFAKLPHTHIALDDAREQGLLFVNMWRAHTA
jgi:hypothetical protein